MCRRSSCRRRTKSTVDLIFDLVLGWVTVRGYTILVFNQSHPGLLSLAIPPWVSTMSTGGGLSHH